MFLLLQTASRVQLPNSRCATLHSTGLPKEGKVSLRCCFVSAQQCPAIGGGQLLRFCSSYVPSYPAILFINNQINIILMTSLVNHPRIPGHFRSTGCIAAEVAGDGSPDYLMTWVFPIPDQKAVRLVDILVLRSYLCVVFQKVYYRRGEPICYPT